MITPPVKFSIGGRCMHDFEIYLLNLVPKYLPVRLIKLGTAVRPYSSKTPTSS
jgi:hypothetical protein